MERDIIFRDVTQPSDLFKLHEHLRELYELIDKRLVTVTRASSVTYDADEGDVFFTELDGNISSITLKHPYRGRTITLIFRQDSMGSRTVSGFDSTVMLAGNAFSVTSNATRYTSITFAYEDTNSKWVEISRVNDVY